MKYRILDAITKKDLEELANTAFLAGFIPTGGVCYAGQRFYQAVVRYMPTCSEYSSPTTLERKAYQKGIKDSWSAVNSMIVSGKLSGSEIDKTAERNGIILATNKIFDLTQQR